MNQIAPITLDEQSASFVEEQLRNGGFETPEQVVQAGLAALRDKIEALRQALAEGEASGDFQPFDFDAFLSEMEAKYPD